MNQKNNLQNSIKSFSITKLDKSIIPQIQLEIDTKIKPQGSLGRLEEIALQIGLIQESITPKLNNSTILVFAGDHGIALEGVSPYPQEVTYQMVMNFLRGGAAINAMCTANNLNLSVVDAGVNYDFHEIEGLVHAKVGYGTKSFLKEPAMSKEECATAIEYGANIVNQLHDNGCNCIGFGEMGIGNTAVSSMLISKILKVPVDDCVGRGTGSNDSELQKKKEILRKASSLHPSPDILSILQNYGGFEIAMIVGGILQAAENKMLILIDGFIVTTALLIANSLYNDVTDYCIYSHLSGEKAHEMILRHLGAKPILNMGMRLGEGTGAALSYSIVATAVQFLNDMATFEEAGVANKS